MLLRAAHAIHAQPAESQACRRGNSRNHGRRLSFEIFTFAYFHQMNTDTDSSKTELEQELAQHIITALNLDISSKDINPLAPLYGDEGLGIDSIDVLEISLMLTKQYGVQLRSDDEKNAEIFASLRNLAKHIQQNRTK
jgi:acyl carrier protein